MEEYLNARPIAEPIRLFDCVMPCAGAEGFLVMTRRARRSAGPGVCARAFDLRAAQCISGRSDSDPRRVGARSRALYGTAGVEPSDIDFVQTYDDYPVMSVIQMEDLGFCRKGEGAEFVRRHSFTTDGHFRSTPAAGSSRWARRAARPATSGWWNPSDSSPDRNLARPVPDARFGLAVGFGMITYDRGLCSAAAVLGRSDA